MIRWSMFIVLLLALLASAIAVVAQRHTSRELFVALQAAQAERDQAKVEWSRLQLEQAWLAESGRIERQARAELDMERPERVGILIEAPWAEATVEHRP
ncbi:cell division protein FtsL [Wenzhouxiangella marina]|uniref:Cell division protein FtsL n=1 Tax=Wenzhouxiangella marina TaxID=1579979 RepID=A0A0K0XYH4_9GAMM|nr:cell division protein FtsL [Wenzhouxiangella marina]AKS42733.1 Cell division protein FtsL [Wenzhouxiangella marina]MBB6088577.1 cell division protein FtsL [Wenzhouxiangella marina]